MTINLEKEEIKILLDALLVAKIYDLYKDSIEDIEQLIAETARINGTRIEIIEAKIRKIIK